MSNKTLKIITRDTPARRQGEKDGEIQKGEDETETRQCEMDENVDFYCQCASSSDKFKAPTSFKTCVTSLPAVDIFYDMLNCEAADLF